MTKTGRWKAWRAEIFLKQQTVLTGYDNLRVVEKIDFHAILIEAFQKTGFSISKRYDRLRICDLCVCIGSIFFRDKYSLSILVIAYLRYWMYILISKNVPLAVLMVILRKVVFLISIYNVSIKSGLQRNCVSQARSGR